MENSLRMVLSSCLLEEPLSLDLPFFSRISSVLDQMGLQAVKQRQITDNWQRQGPDYWLRTIKAVPAPIPLYFPLSFWSVGDSASCLRSCGNISNPAPAFYHRSFFFFFFLSWVAAQIRSQKLLTLNKVSLDLSVCLLDGMEPKIFSAADRCRRLALALVQI